MMTYVDDEDLYGMERLSHILFDMDKEAHSAFMAALKRTGATNEMIAKLQTHLVVCPTEQRAVITAMVRVLRHYLPVTKENIAAQLPDVDDCIEPEYVDEDAYRMYYGLGATFLTAAAAKHFINKELVVVTGHFALGGTRQARTAALQKLTILAIEKGRIEAEHDGRKVDYFYIFGGDLVTGAAADPVVYFE